MFDEDPGLDSTPADPGCKTAPHLLGWLPKSVRRTTLFSSTLAAGAALTVALAAPAARAHSNGFAVEGCTGCHNGGAKPSISVKFSPESPAPGDTVTLDVAIQAVNGNTGGSMSSPTAGARSSTSAGKART